MKWVLALLVFTGLLFAQVHQNNIRYLQQIDNAMYKIDVYARAYFGGVDIAGITMPLTQAQKDALRILVNNQIDIIQTYADSLQQYSP